MEGNASRPSRIIVLDRLCYGVQLRRVGSDPAVEARGERNEPEEEHDPDRVVDGINDECALHVDQRNVQRSLDLRDIVVAADPRAGKRPERHPGIGAEIFLRDEEGDDETGCDRDGRSAEAEEHARPEAENLADVRAQEHREDHRIGQDRRKLAIDRLRRCHAPKAEGGKKHRSCIDEDDAGNDAKDRPPCRPFGGKDKGCKKYKDGDIGKAVGDHGIPPFGKRFAAIISK